MRDRIKYFLRKTNIHLLYISVLLLLTQRRSLDVFHPNCFILAHICYFSFVVILIIEKADQINK